MKRNTFQTKNKLKVHTYVYIVLMLFVLLALFLIIGNLYTFAAWGNLDGHEESAAKTESLLNSDMDEVDAQYAALQESRVENSEMTVGIYGEGDLLDMAKNQLELMRLPWMTVESEGDTSEALDRLGLLVIAKETLSQTEIEWLTELTDGGISLLFLELPGEKIMQNTDLKDLIGVKEVGEKTTWPGMRTSSDMLTGSVIEDDEEEVTAYEVTLKDQNKIYCCALPKGYGEMDNEDLPPLIWRYVRTGGCGSVYVCNGDFMDGEVCYGILPIVMRELQGSVLYPIVNAYCVFADGSPYTLDEERESWTRLYSRDSLGIQQDMLMPQFKRYASLYDSVITYFSRDYDILADTDDADLSYYMREVQSNQGVLALKDDDGMHVLSADEPLDIVEWDTGFLWWNSEEKCFRLPVNYTANENDMPGVFHVAGMIGGMGYYCVRLDVEGLLDYDGQKDIWMDYCKNVETLLGTHDRDFEYMERVSAGEALNRVNQLLNMEFEVSYYDDRIEVTVDNVDGESWYMLCTDHENLSIDNGTIEEAGNECYMVTMTEKTAVITWEDEEW